MIIPKEYIRMFEYTVEEELKRENKIRRELHTKSLSEIFEEYGRW